MIWLTGAGCGHPDMLTVGARRLLEEADCILYDNLINPEFLRYAKPGCECICVGKSGHHPSFPQEEILKLMKEKDRIYPLTVRLKGGDPFVFGRGGEEMAFCLENGIDCRYMPGISSAVGALGYAGIPVTERGVSEGFHVHTLHFRDGKDHLDYNAIARCRDTQIFFMGSTHIRELAAGCLACGMPAETRITLASRLTQPGQKVLNATLGTVQDLDLSACVSPMLIVLGETCAHQPAFDSAARLSCFGRRILLPILDDDTWPADRLCMEKGIFVSERRAGVTEAAVPAALPEDCTAVLFVSRRSVRAFIRLLHSRGRDLRILHGMSVFCIGGRTAEALRNAGILADRIFADRRSFLNAGLPAAKLLWVGPADVPPPAGAVFCGCYRVKETPFTADGHYDAAAATCPVSVRMLARSGLPLDTPLFCFSGRTLKAAEQAGFTDIVPCPNSRQAVLDAMIRRLEGEPG